MATLSRDDRRINRRHVLLALESETGSQGGDVAAPRVRAYCADPRNAPTTEFGYVGALALKRFYIDESKPNGAERQGLWQEITTRMGKPGATNPGGWDGTTLVLTLQAIAEEA